MINNEIKKIEKQIKSTQKFQSLQRKQKQYVLFCLSYLNNHDLEDTVRVIQQEKKYVKDLLLNPAQELIQKVNDAKAKAKARKQNRRRKYKDIEVDFESILQRGRPQEEDFGEMLQRLKKGYQNDQIVSINFDEMVQRLKHKDEHPTLDQMINSQQQVPQIDLEDLSLKRFFINHVDQVQFKDNIGYNELQFIMDNQPDVENLDLNKNNYELNEIPEAYKHMDQILKQRLPKFNETNQKYDNFWLMQLTYYNFDQDSNRGYLVNRFIPITQVSMSQIKNLLFDLINSNKVTSDQYDQFNGFSILVQIQFISVSEAMAQMLIQNQGQVLYQKAQGSYFNYTCKIDCLEPILRQYQIGTKSTNLDELNELHCLLYSLKQQIQNKEEYDEIVNLFNCNFQFKKDNLKRLNLKRPVIIAQLNKGKIGYSRLDPGQNSFKQVLGDTIGCIMLGLFLNHYFTYNYTGVTLKWLNNFKQISELHNQGKINEAQWQQYTTTFNLSDFKQVRGKYYLYYKADLGQTMTSLQFVKQLFEQDYLEQIQEINKQNYKQIKDDVIINPIISKDNTVYYQKENFKTVKVYEDIIDADFEAFTKDSNGNNIAHKPFMLCAVTTKTNMKFSNSGNIFKLLCDINQAYKCKGKTFLIRFYNLSYDANFIYNSDFQIRNIIKKGTKTVCFEINCGNNKFVFTDNLLMFNTKLKDLPNMFFTSDEKQKIHKEYFPYTYYTEELYQNKVGNIDDALKHISNATRQDFVDSIINADALLGDNTFDLKKYAEYYCFQDVEVQRLANIKMNQLTEAQLQLSSNQFISISSMSQQYFRKELCYEGCYKSHGLTRKYIQQFVCGGRCMVANNGKYKTNLKLQDFDARSLYPSAMKRCYFPTGLPKKLSQEQINYYNIPENLFKITEDQNSQDQNTLFLTVELFKSKDFINRMFPVIDNGYMNSEELEGRQFTNDQTGIHFLTHIRLQDAVMFQNYQYKIIDGIYFEGRNYQIQKVIQKIYDERNRCKTLQQQSTNEDDIGKYKGLQTMYKLIMNSSYGKCIEKLHDKNICMFKNSDGMQSKEVLNYIHKNFFQITELQSFNDNKDVEIQTIKEVLDDEWNFNQCGVIILDYSKRIMNEVMCLAEDLKIKMFYQDTDSIHMEDSKVNLLQQAYNKKYGRDLIGSKLGQFHSDFESKTHQEVLYSDYSIFCGKKCYMDRMILEDGSYEFKMCMKGVPQVCIENHELGVQSVYENLFEGDEVMFDLAEYVVCMDFNDSKLGKYMVVNKDQFQRTLKFDKQMLMNEDEMYQFAD